MNRQELEIREAALVKVIANKNKALEEVREQLAALPHEQEVDDSYVGHVVMMSDDGSNWYEQFLHQIDLRAEQYLTPTKTIWPYAKPCDHPTMSLPIKHNGGECPVKVGVKVKVRFKYGRWDVNEFIAEHLRWKHIGTDTDIIEYMTIKEPA